MSTWAHNLSKGGTTLLATAIVSYISNICNDIQEFSEDEDIIYL